MTDTPRTVEVRLGERSYAIHIGAGLVDRLGELSKGTLAAGHAVLVADENVAGYAERAAGSLSAAGFDADILLVEGGEEAKCVETAAQLWEQLAAVAADRKTVVFTVGGGVIGDLAGFVAASYARGLPLVHVPTTLLAQVDSSVGGKVGINLPAAKNMVGAFWQPRLVAIDPTTLETLPDREYRSGLAEVVKYGVILDAALFADLETHVAQLLAREPAVLESVIARCCRLKADVVEQDEREESGLRAVLNYGHTFAHAIESTSGYGRFLHGEAVAIGMHCAARLAERLGRVESEFVARQRDLLVALGLAVSDESLGAGAVDGLLAAMAHDKKVERGRLRFVLPDRLGHVELVEGVATADVRGVLAE